VVRARRAWLAVHRWLGLALGGALALLGLTGSVIVFDHAIDAWLNPALFTPRTPGPARSLDEIVAAARGAAPDGAWRVSVSMPGVDHDVFTVYLAPAGSTAPPRRPVEITVDPASGAVLGRRDADSNLTTVIYRLHSTLLLGDTFGIDDLGTYVVGFAGLGLLGSIVSGLYLWWPRWGQLGGALVVHWRGSVKRVNFDLHRAVGFWSALVLLVSAGSGVYLTFPDYVRPLVGLASPITPLTPTATSDPRPGARPITAGEAARAATRALPDATVTFVSLPAGPRDVYRLALRRPSDVRRVSGNNRVWIDQYSGEVVSARTIATMSAGDVVLEWQFPLHSGEAFGLAGRLVVFTVGLVPTLLAVTGTTIWWRKRRARRRLARASAAVL
jgi:uncharacterized iron-regulated membrane protein